MTKRANRKNKPPISEMDGIFIMGGGVWVGSPYEIKQFLEILAEMTLTYYSGEFKDFHPDHPKMPPVIEPGWIWLDSEVGPPERVVSSRDRSGCFTLAAIWPAAPSGSEMAVFAVNGHGHTNDPPPIVDYWQKFFPRQDSLQLIETWRKLSPV